MSGQSLDMIMIVDSAVRFFSCFQSLLSLPHVFLQRSFVYQINIRKVALHIEASYVTDTYTFPCSTISIS